METAMIRMMHDGMSGQEDANREVIVYRSILAELPSFLLLIGLTVGAVWFSREFPQSVLDGSVGRYELYLPLALVLPILYGAVILHRLYNCRYVITDRYVRAINGVFSLRKKERFIEYHNIRAIEIDRGLIERILNIGDLHIASAAYSNVEIHLKGISDPSYYRDLIMARTRVEIHELYEPSNHHGPTTTIVANGESFNEGSFPKQRDYRS